MGRWMGHACQVSGRMGGPRVSALMEGGWAVSIGFEGGWIGREC